MTNIKNITIEKWQKKISLLLMFFMYFNKTNIVYAAKNLNSKNYYVCANGKCNDTGEDSDKSGTWKVEEDIVMENYFNSGGTHLGVYVNPGGLFGSWRIDVDPSSTYINRINEIDGVNKSSDRNDIRGKNRNGTFYIGKNYNNETVNINYLDIGTNDDDWGYYDTSSMISKFVIGEGAKVDVHQISNIYAETTFIGNNSTLTLTNNTDFANPQMTDVGETYAKYIISNITATKYSPGANYSDSTNATLNITDINVIGHIGNSKTNVIRNLNLYGTQDIAKGHVFSNIITNTGNTTFGYAFISSNKADNEGDKLHVLGISATDRTFDVSRINGTNKGGRIDNTGTITFYNYASITVPYINMNSQSSTLNLYNDNSLINGTIRGFKTNAVGNENVNYGNVNIYVNYNNSNGTTKFGTRTKKTDIDGNIITGPGSDGTDASQDRYVTYSLANINVLNNRKLTLGNSSVNNSKNGINDVYTQYLNIYNGSTVQLNDGTSGYNYSSFSPTIHGIIRGSSSTNSLTNGTGGTLIINGNYDNRYNYYFDENNSYGDTRNGNYNDRTNGITVGLFTYKYDSHYDDIAAPVTIFGDSNHRLDTIQVNSGKTLTIGGNSGLYVDNVVLLGNKDNINATSILNINSSASIFNGTTIKGQLSNNTVGTGTVNLNTDYNNSDINNLYHESGSTKSSQITQFGNIIYNADKTKVTGYEYLGKINVAEGVTFTTGDLDVTTKDMMYVNYIDLLGKNTILNLNNYLYGTIRGRYETDEDRYVGNGAVQGHNGIVNIGKLNSTDLAVGNANRCEHDHCYVNTGEFNGLGITQFGTLDSYISKLNLAEELYFYTGSNKIYSDETILNKDTHMVFRVLNSDGTINKEGNFLAYSIIRGSEDNTGVVDIEINYKDKQNVTTFGVFGKSLNQINVIENTRVQIGNDDPTSSYKYNPIFSNEINLGGSIGITGTSQTQTSSATLDINNYGAVIHGTIKGVQKNGYSGIVNFNSIYNDALTYDIDPDAKPYYETSIYTKYDKTPKINNFGYTTYGTSEYALEEININAGNQIIETKTIRMGDDPIGERTYQIPNDNIDNGITGTIEVTEKTTPSDKTTSNTVKTIEYEIGKKPIGETTNTTNSTDGLIKTTTTEITTSLKGLILTTTQHITETIEDNERNSTVISTNTNGLATTTKAESINLDGYYLNTNKTTTSAIVNDVSNITSDSDYNQDNNTLEKIETNGTGMAREVKETTTSLQDLTGKYLTTNTTRTTNISNNDETNTTTATNNYGLTTTTQVNSELANTYCGGSTNCFIKTETQQQDNIQDTVSNLRNTLGLASSENIDNTSRTIVEKNSDGLTSTIKTYTIGACDTNTGQCQYTLETKTSSFTDTNVADGSTYEDVTGKYITITTIIEETITDNDNGNTTETDTSGNNDNLIYEISKASTATSGYLVTTDEVIKKYTTNSTEPGTNESLDGKYLVTMTVTDNILDSNVRNISNGEIIVNNDGITSTTTGIIIDSYELDNDDTLTQTTTTITTIGNNNQTYDDTIDGNKTGDTSNTGNIYVTTKETINYNSEDITGYTQTEVVTKITQEGVIINSVNPIYSKSVNISDNSSLVINNPGAIIHGAVKGKTNDVGILKFNKSYNDADGHTVFGYELDESNNIIKKYINKFYISDNTRTTIGGSPKGIYITDTYLYENSELMLTNNAGIVKGTIQGIDDGYGIVIIDKDYANINVEDKEFTQFGTEPKSLGNLIVTNGHELTTNTSIYSDIISLYSTGTLTIAEMINNQALYNPIIYGTIQGATYKGQNCNSCGIVNLNINYDFNDATTFGTRTNHLAKINVAPNTTFTNRKPVFSTIIDLNEKTIVNDNNTTTYTSVLNLIGGSKTGGFLSGTVIGANSEVHIDGGAYSTKELGREYQTYFGNEETRLARLYIDYGATAIDGKDKRERELTISTPSYIDEIYRRFEKYKDEDYIFDNVLKLSPGASYNETDFKFTRYTNPTDEEKNQLYITIGSHYYLEDKAKQLLYDISDNKEDVSMDTLGVEDELRFIVIKKGSIKDILVNNMEYVLGTIDDKLELDYSKSFVISDEIDSEYVGLDPNYPLYLGVETKENNGKLDLIIVNREPDWTKFSDATHVTSDILNEWIVAGDMNEEMQSLTNKLRYTNRYDYWQGLKELTPDVTGLNLQMANNASKISIRNTNNRLQYYQLLKFITTTHQFNFKNINNRNMMFYNDFYNKPYHEEGEWFELFGGIYDQNSVENIFGYRFEYYGGSVGYDIKPSPDTLIGFTYTYNNVNGKDLNDVKKNRDEIKGDIHTGNIYGMLYSKWAYITLIGGGSFGMYKQERNISFFNLEESPRSKYNGYSVYGNAELGINIPIANFNNEKKIKISNSNKSTSKLNEELKAYTLGTTDNLLLLTPKISFYYDRSDIQKFKEFNYELTGLEIDTEPYTTQIASLGFDIISAFLTDGGMHVQPTLSAKLNYHLNVERVKLKARFLIDKDQDHFFNVHGGDFTDDRTKKKQYIDNFSYDLDFNMKFIFKEFMEFGLNVGYSGSNVFHNFTYGAKLLHSF